MIVATVLVLSLLGPIWWFALSAWPELPPRIPVHFNLFGEADGFAGRGAWFFLPVLATVLVPLLGAILPRVSVRLAAANSPMLNVPDRRRFRALPLEDRVRAMGPVVILLRLIAIEIAALFFVLLLGTQRVATGAWPALPEPWFWLGVGSIVLTAILGSLWSLLAVRRLSARAPT